MLDAELALLCPHLRVSPERIRSFGNHATSEDRMEYVCHCATCFLDIRFLLADGIERRQPQISCRRADYRLNDFEWWSRGVSPESYGLFSDEQTKNILWCDDRQCVTSFELISCYVSNIWLPINLGAVLRYSYFQRKTDPAFKMATALELGRTSCNETDMLRRGEPLGWR